MTSRLQADAVLKLILGGSGAGAGAVLGLAVWRLVESEPAAVLQLVSGWGPLAVLGVVGMVLADKRFGQLIDSQAKNAEAQQSLAAAVNRLVERDDEKAREMELVIGHLARNTERILDRVSAIEEKLPTRAHGHFAG